MSDTVTIRIPSKRVLFALLIVAVAVFAALFVYSAARLKPVTKERNELAQTLATVEAERDELATVLYSCTSLINGCGSKMFEDNRVSHVWNWGVAAMFVTKDEYPLVAEISTGDRADILLNYCKRWEGFVGD